MMNTTTLPTVLTSSPETPGGVPFGQGNPL
jgi:hypothetical protein